MKKITVITVIALLLTFSSGWLSAQPLTGDDILERASNTGSITALGNRISLMDFNITDSTDLTITRTFATFSKREEGQPNRLLIYFLEPELERGTIFLSVDPETTNEQARFWLFLSALGQAKELVSSDDRSSGFAGSNLSNDQIGTGLDFSEDYTAEVVGEDSISVNWLGQGQVRSAFRLALTQIPEAEVDFPTGVAWVDMETFVVLKAELNNDSGALTQITTVDDFVEFNGDVEPNRIVIDDAIEGGQTEILISERQQLEDLPDDIFIVDNLSDFNPEDFGIEL